MQKTNENIFPFDLTGNFKPECKGCPALDVDMATMSANGESIVVLLCANEPVCTMLEQRPAAQDAGINPGARVWFANGQTGVIKELAICDTSTTPIVRIAKYLGDDAYEVTHSISDIGKVVFLKPEDIQTDQKAEAEHEER